MFYHSFLIKYAEIGTKGKNRYIFEDALMHDIRHKLNKIDGEFAIQKEQGRIYVNAKTEYEYDDVIDALSRVFGITGICPMMQIEKCGYDELREKVLAFVKEEHPEQSFSFKVHARRADKHYPVNSDIINADVGYDILCAYPEARVDVHHPDFIVYIEVRQKINVYTRVLPGAGGMPMGTNGKAMLLLSGGIDSPVAGYMIAKRGVTIEAVYFHAPPYTSERAKEKVVELARLVARFSGPIKLHVINFTDIQLYIYEKCPHDELTIIMRRYMMRIAERLAEQDDCIGLITGESIGQVASQTMFSLRVTDEVCELPVYRPVIGFDKQEIVDLAEKIGTFETSILPYEDCCTIFVAKHPVTKPNLKSIQKSEKKLSERIDELFEAAIASDEIIWCDK
ncbi:MAG TPA: tRNA 4-thiouridine(8) synthase ThiI [Candidatus Avilachnospira avicola]|nr:tRNA 4-thiouridine(8) synthase ThiI [Candidatus Avilachnospira avicola]